MHRNTLPVLIPLLIVLLAPPLHAQEAEPADAPRLRLISQEWTAQVGDSVELKLVLELPRAAELFKGQPETRSGSRTYANDETTGPNAFIMDDYFTAQEEGFTEIGPFEMEVDGEAVTSNAVEMQVFPAWRPDETGFRFELSDETVKVGQPFGLTVRQRTFGDNGTVNLNVADGYWHNKGPLTIDGNRSSSSSSFDNNRRARNSSHTFTLTAREAGELRITREMFRDLPEDLELPELIVDVVAE